MLADGLGHRSQILYGVSLELSLVETHMTDAVKNTCVYGNSVGQIIPLNMLY